MTRAGKFTKIWVEQRALEAYILNANISSVFDEHEAGAYSEDKRYNVGRGDASVAIEGFLDDTTDASHDAFKAISIASSLITIALGNNATPTVGDIAACFDAQQVNYDVSPALEDLVTFTADMKARGNPIEWGVLLADATVTANGNQSSVDQAAQTTSGGVGYLHITSLSAGDTITVLIEDSANDSTWATLITFTLDGTAVDAERVATSTTETVDRYVRASYTVTGASISFPIAVAFKRTPTLP
jgi:hypothetical protein